MEGWHSRQLEAEATRDGSYWFVRRLAFSILSYTAQDALPNDITSLQWAGPSYISQQSDNSLQAPAGQSDRGSSRIEVSFSQAYQVDNKT